MNTLVVGKHSTPRMTDTLHFGNMFLCFLPPLATYDAILKATFSWKFCCQVQICQNDFNFVFKLLGGCESII